MAKKNNVGIKKWAKEQKRFKNRPTTQICNVKFKIHFANFSGVGIMISFCPLCPAIMLMTTLGGNKFGTVKIQKKFPINLFF
jgi:hypothetical protein